MSTEKYRRRSLAKFDSARSADERISHRRITNNSNSNSRSHQKTTPSCQNSYKEFRRRQETYSPEPTTPSKLSENSFSDNEDYLGMYCKNLDDSLKSDYLSPFDTIEQEDYDEISEDEDDIDDELSESRSMSPFEDITSFPAVSFIKYSMPKQVDSNNGHGNHGSKPILVSSCTVTNSEPKRVSGMANEKSFTRHKSSSNRHESTSPNYLKDNKHRDDYKAYYHLSSDKTSAHSHSRHHSYDDISSTPDKQSSYNTYGYSNNTSRNKEYQYYKRYDYDHSNSRKSTPTHRKIDSDEVIKVSKMKLKPENSKYSMKNKYRHDGGYHDLRVTKEKYPMCSELNSINGSDSDSMLGSAEDSSYSDAYLIQSDDFKLALSTDDCNEEITTNILRMDWIRRSIAPLTAIAGAILIGIANLRK